MDPGQDRNQAGGYNGDVALVVWWQSDGPPLAEDLVQVSVLKINQKFQLDETQDIS